MDESEARRLVALGAQNEDLQQVQYLPDTNLALPGLSFSVQRFRYLPLSNLSSYDTRTEKGLDRLIYIQALIDEDNES
jgi:hypothetical protein